MSSHRDELSGWGLQPKTLKINAEPRLFQQWPLEWTWPSSLNTQAGMCLKTLTYIQMSRIHCLHISKYLGVYVSTQSLWLIFPYRHSVYAQHIWSEDMLLEWVWMKIPQWIFKTPLLSISELLSASQSTPVTCYFVGFNNIPINIHTACCISSFSFKGK